MNNAQKIIDKIKTEDIRPKPAYQYLLSEGLKKLAFVVFIMWGSLSFSVILFAISESGFDLIQHIRHSGFETVLVLLPILWLSMLIVFLSASVFSVMSTGRAYKYTLGKWIGLCAALSMVAGTLFFVTGGAKWFENEFETHIASYESILEKKTDIWSQPALGTLSGEIIAVENDTILLRDWKNQRWNIPIAGAFIAPVVQLEEGVQIKMNGTLLSGQIFKADKIRPWGGIPGKCVGPGQ